MERGKDKDGSSWFIMVVEAPVCFVQGRTTGSHETGATSLQRQPTSTLYKAGTTSSWQFKHVFVLSRTGTTSLWSDSSHPSNPHVKWGLPVHGKGASACHMWATLGLGWAWWGASNRQSSIRTFPNGLNSQSSPVYLSSFKDLKVAFLGTLSHPGNEQHSFWLPSAGITWLQMMPILSYYFLEYAQQQDLAFSVFSYTAVARLLMRDTKF